MIPIKTAQEIEHIRSACKIVAEVLLEIKKIIKEDLTTAEIDALGEKLLIEKGAYPAFKGYRGYKHALCLSVNEEVVHGIPGEKKLKEGDIIGVDVGAIVSGYYGDTASTFAVGKIAKKAERLLRAGKEALMAGIKQARSGNHLGDISFAIESCAQKYGYSVVRDLFGHGVGKELHEEPLIPNFGKKGEGPELKAGMVLAIEPMLNIGGYKIKTLADGWTVETCDKSLSVHFEHTILVTKGDPEILTDGKR